MSSQPLPPPSSVLITGANGFVGRTLLAAAAAARLRVRAAVRSDPAPEFKGEQTAVGEIHGQTDWSQALAGIDGIVHLAARVLVMKPTAKDRSEFEHTNVLGTERLARAAAQYGVKRFVYLSSIKVNGESSGDRRFRADDMPQPQDDYARSKLEAERRLVAIEAATGMCVSIVRSPLVYGPGVGGNFYRLLSVVRSGLPIPLTGIVNVRSMVSVWNLCDLVLALLRHERATSGVVLVADGEAVATAELVRRLAGFMHRPARLFPMPVGALRLLAALTGRTAELNRLCDSLAIDISETRARLGWSPPFTLDAGLRRTVQWYAEEIARRTAR
jgi:nucleoside-diphosphate-sugar epimerase